MTERMSVCCHLAQCVWASALLSGRIIRTKLRSVRHGHEVAFKIDLLQAALRKNSLDDLQFVRVNYYGAESKGNALMFEGALNNMKILSEGGTLPARVFLAAYSGHRQYQKSGQFQIGRTPLIVRNKKAPGLRRGLLFIQQGSAYRLTWTVVPPPGAPLPGSPGETNLTQSELLALKYEVSLAWRSASRLA